MKKEKLILQILANRFGVYEVGVRAAADQLGDQYDCADRLSAGIRPAIAIIDEAIRDTYAEVNNPLRPSWKASPSSPHSREKEANDDRKV